MAQRVVVVGGSLAGLRAAETLRAEGFEGRISFVGAEERLPYDRPPLSKKVLSGEWEPERIALRKHGDVDSLELDLRLGIRAEGLDLAARSVRAQRRIGGRHSTVWSSPLGRRYGACPVRRTWRASSCSGLWTSPSRSGPR